MAVIIVEVVKVELIEILAVAHGFPDGGPTANGRCFIDCYVMQLLVTKQKLGERD